MPPPQLPGNAPVTDIIHPVKIRRFPCFGNNFCFAFHHRRDRLLGQWFDFDKPLFGNHRFNICFTAVTLTDVMRVRFSADKIAAFFQIGNYVLTCFVAILPFVCAAIFIDDSLAVDNCNDLQIMPLSHGKVIRIGTGSDLYRTGTEIHRYIFIGYNRYFFIH